MGNKYVSHTKVAEFLDRIFDKEGFDYHKAKRAQGIIQTKSKFRSEQKNDKELEVVKNIFPEYYKTIFIPSKEDIEKVLNDENVSEKDKKILRNLIESGVLDGVAYITKAISTVNGTRRLVYMQAISTDFIKIILDEIGDLNNLSKEDEELLKFLGKYLNGVMYHESLGHGALKHLEKNLFPFNHNLANILEDLVINIRLKRKFPLSYQTLQEVIGGGVDDNSQKRFPDVRTEFIRLYAYQNKEKFKDKINEAFPEFDFDREAALKEILNHIKSNSVLYNFYNDEVNQMFNEYIEKIQKDPANLALYHFELIDKLAKYYVEKDNMSITALDNAILTLTNHIFETTRKFAKQDIQYDINEKERIMYVNDYKNFVKQYVKNKLGFLDKISPDDLEIGNPKNQPPNQPPEGGGGGGGGGGKGKDKPQKRGGGGDSNKPQGPQENGDLDKFSDIFNDDDFMEELDEDMEKKLNDNLNQKQKELEEKIDDDRRRGPRGDNPLFQTENLEYMKDVDSLSVVLSKILESDVFKEILNESKKRIPKVIPIPNKGAILSQSRRSGNVKGIPFGDIANTPVEPENDTLILSILDTSGSRDTADLSAQRSALYNISCKTDNVVMMEIENDASGISNLKVLDKKRNSYNKDKEEQFKVTGRGGTEHFGAILKILLSGFNQDVIEKIAKEIGQGKKELELIERMKEEFKRSFKKEPTAEEIRKMIEEGKLKILLPTDTDIIQTDLFRDVELHKMLEGLNINEPFIYIIASNKEAEKIERNARKGQKQLKVVGTPIFKK